MIRFSLFTALTTEGRGDALSWSEDKFFKGTLYKRNPTQFMLTID